MFCSRRKLFPGPGRKSLPNIYSATNPLRNRHLALLEIGEAFAPWCREVNSMITRALLALAVLASVVLFWGLGSPRAAFLHSPRQWELPGSHGPQDDEQSQVKEFKGKISK